MTDNPVDIPVDDVDSLGPCPDCTHDLVNHEGDGYSRGPCLDPGCFCGHEDVTIPAAQWAAVTGLPDQWLELADALNNPASVVAYTVCAAELEQATKGEGCIASNDKVTLVEDDHAEGEG